MSDSAYGDSWTNTHWKTCMRVKSIKRILGNMYLRNIKQLSVIWQTHARERERCRMLYPSSPIDFFTTTTTDSLKTGIVENSIKPQHTAHTLSLKHTLTQSPQTIYLCLYIRLVPVFGECFQNIKKWIKYPRTIRWRLYHAFSLCVFSRVIEKWWRRE